MSGIPNRMGGGARRREDCPIYTEKKRKEKAGYVIPVMVMRLSLRADPVVSRPAPVLHRVAMFTTTLAASLRAARRCAPRQRPTSFRSFVTAGSTSSPSDADSTAHPCVLYSPSSYRYSYSHSHSRKSGSPSSSSISSERNLSLKLLTPS